MAHAATTTSTTADPDADPAETGLLASIKAQIVFLFYTLVSTSLASWDDTVQLPSSGQLEAEQQNQNEVNTSGV